jgi:hypothetical protein
MKYVFVLMLLGQDHETGEIDWREAVRSKPISFQVCIENVVETTNTLTYGGIEHRVYCEPAPEEKDDDG